MKRRLLVGAAILIFLAHVAPQTAPQVVRPVEAQIAPSPSYYTRTAVWWLDGSTEAYERSGVFRVKVGLNWQTTDPKAACHPSGPAAPDGTPQWRFTNLPLCPYPEWKYGGASKAFSPTCWVANSFLVNTTIDYCGKFDWLQQHNPPYYHVYGAIFRVCIGIPNTILSYCGRYITKATIQGSMVRIWNTSNL